MSKSNESNNYNENNKVFEDFIKQNQDVENDIDYFYILDHLEESKIDNKEIDNLLSERFTIYEQNKIKTCKK